MKFIPLSSLQNPYPSITKYREESNSISIKGFYQENELNIPVRDFNTLGIIPNTKFRFVVRFFDNESSQRVLNTFTSEQYYNDLLRAKKSKNPYFINTALNPQTFVKLYLSRLQQTFNTRVSVERQYGVSVVFNNLFNSDGSVNYQRFGQYLDWVVSQPNLNDIIDNGVLPSNQISSFNVSEFTPPDLPNIDIPDRTATGGGSNNNTGGGTPTGGGSSDIQPPDTNDLIDPREGPGIDFGDDRVNIPDTIIIDGQEFPVTPLPNDIVGGGPTGGEGERGNISRNESQSNRTGNPMTDIENEYTVRYRNESREL